MKVSKVQSVTEKHYKTKMQIISLPADMPELYEATKKFLYEEIPFNHGQGEITISVRFPLPGSKFPLLAKKIVSSDNSEEKLKLPG